jgi:hypothetical protein
MLLINQTRAIAALKDAGFSTSRDQGDCIMVGAFDEFPPAAYVCGNPMYDQRAIAQFIAE